MNMRVAGGVGHEFSLIWLMIFSTVRGGAQGGGGLVRLVRLNLRIVSFGSADWQALAKIFLLLIRVRFAFDPGLIRF
jgi:hypothetical protein